MSRKYLSQQCVLSTSHTFLYASTLRPNRTTWPQMTHTQTHSYINFHQYLYTWSDSYLTQTFTCTLSYNHTHSKYNTHPLKDFLNPTRTQCSCIMSEKEVYIRLILLIKRLHSRTSSSQWRHNRCDGHSCIQYAGRSLRKRLTINTGMSIQYHEGNISSCCGNWFLYGRQRDQRIEQ